MRESGAAGRYAGVGGYLSDLHVLGSYGLDMNVVAIVQARTSSSRLRGKVLLPLGPRAMILHVLSRVRLTVGVTTTVLATTEEEQDNPLASLAADAGYNVFRGHPTDVLGRYLACATEYGADVVMRVTGDCPLWSPLAGAVVLSRYLEQASERQRTFGQYSRPYYASNIPASGQAVCDGFDVEVFSAVFLTRAHMDYELRPGDREHVTPAIRRKAASMHRMGYVPVPPATTPKLSVDTGEDFARVEAIVERYGGSPPLNWAAYVDGWVTT